MVRNVSFLLNLKKTFSYLFYGAIYLFSYPINYLSSHCYTGARLIKEKQILTPTKSDANGTLTAYFKFYNIGNISITCVHLIITTDTDEIKYRISSGGIGHDYVNFSVEGSNGNVMMSRAVVYGI